MTEGGRNRPPHSPVLHRVTHARSCRASARMDAVAKALSHWFGSGAPDSDGRQRRDAV